MKNAKKENNTRKQIVQNTKKKNVSKKNVQAKNSKTNVNKNRIIAILFLFIITALVVFILFFSGLFNIKKITVINNVHIKTEEIINLSGMQIGKNMFKIKSKEKIKTNAYIENVKISRKINGEIIIDVEEREPTYILNFEGKYAFINNQGYILEINDNIIDVTEIKGYSTKEIKTGNRLDVEDLQKLNSIIQIMDTAKNKEMKDIIKSIDITNSYNFILEIPSELKTVEFGDTSDIRYKLDCVEKIMSLTKGEEGTIIVKNAVTKAPYFREKV